MKIDEKDLEEIYQEAAAILANTPDGESASEAANIMNICQRIASQNGLHFT